MKKKIVGILVCMLLISTAFPVIGNTNEETNLEEQPIINPNIGPNIIDLINQVNEDMLFYYLEKFVSFGSKRAGSANADKAANWIKSEFEEVGLYTYLDNWKLPLCQDKNVVALHNGTDLTSDATILISAHYDTTKGSSGAIDDGTGIALMLAIANVTKDSSFNHTIRFIATAAEERGTRGSFADAKKAYENDENIIAVLNVDCVGFDNSSKNKNIVCIGTPSRAYWLVEFVKDISIKYKPQFDIIPQFGGYNVADHESYNDYGYDVIGFAQTKLEELMDVINSPDDTIDNVNFTYLKKVTKLVLAVACELAIKPIDVQVRIISPMEGCIYIKDKPIKIGYFNLVFSRVRAVTYIIGRTTVKLNITTKEEINSVYFYLDEYVRHACNEEPYKYKIGKGEFRGYYHFTMKGYHKLTVRVLTNTGKVATDEMDIYIVTNI